MMGDEDDKGRRCEKKAAKRGNGDQSRQGRDERIGAGITEKEERAIQSAALWYGTGGVKGRQVTMEFVNSLPKESRARITSCSSATGRANASRQRRSVDGGRQSGTCGRMTGVEGR